MKLLITDDVIDTERRCKHDWVQSKCPECAVALRQWFERTLRGRQPGAKIAILPTHRWEPWK